MADRKNIN